VPGAGNSIFTRVIVLWFMRDQKRVEEKGEEKEGSFTPLFRPFWFAHCINHHKLQLFVTRAFLPSVVLQSFDIVEYYFILWIELFISLSYCFVFSQIFVPEMRNFNLSGAFKIIYYIKKLRLILMSHNIFVRKITKILLSSNTQTETEIYWTKCVINAFKS